MTRRPRVAPMLAGVVIFGLVGACAPPPTAVSYGGDLVIVAPSPDFAAELAHHRLPPDWVTLGALGGGSLAAREIDGVPALRVVNGATPFVAVRRVDSRLSVTPYLSWIWHPASPPPAAPHPVHLVVGFRDAADGGSGPWFGLGSRLPAHDQLLALTWGRSALERGTLRPATPDGRPSRYVVRGGDAGERWHAETVDLTDLYHRLWPGRPQDAVRVAFVGIAAAGGAPATPMHLAAITLSR